jgi:hypothetical protein
MIPFAEQGSRHIKMQRARYSTRVVDSSWSSWPDPVHRGEYVTLQSLALAVDVLF